jgi:hypothetical protein
MAKVRTSLGVAAVVVVAAGLAQTPPGHTLLRAIGLSQAPAAYTQLYFTGPRTLPVTLASPDATVAVPFGIRNTSPANRGYQWSITLVRGGNTQQLASGSAQVASGTAATVARAVTFSCAPGRVRVEVGLASPRESIAFWATCQPGGSPSPKAAAR